MKTTKKEMILKAIKNNNFDNMSYTEIIDSIQLRTHFEISRSYIRKIYKAYISENNNNNNSNNEIKHDIVDISTIIKDMELISKVKNISVSDTFNNIYKEKVNKNIKSLFKEIKDIHKNNDNFNSSFESLDINYISESNFTDIIDNNIVLNINSDRCYCGGNTLLNFNRLYSNLIYIKDTIIEFFNNNINNFVIKKSDISICKVMYCNYYAMTLNLYCYSIITDSFYELVISQSKNDNDILSFYIAD